MSLHYSLLDERLVRYRDHHGAAETATLPELFAALAADAVRDFPALRPHQRHPWHAFLTQLGALAMHAAGRATPFPTASEWRRALLALTPGHPGGEPWCLVAPSGEPGFMQPPVPAGNLAGWKDPIFAADELDMLVTSRNHDLKTARMRRATPEDWLFALVSLQTQDGYPGAGNYGISRMNGGLASRPAVGVVPTGGWGRRWSRDIRILLACREKIVVENGLKAVGGIALAWLAAWDGSTSLAFSSLDPFYIEVCRRVRLGLNGADLIAFCTGSKSRRIAAEELHGLTGDPWTPIDPAAEALTVRARGFHHKLACDLLLDKKYHPAATQTLLDDDGDEGVVMLAQAVVRGKGKTEGYHERRIPISRQMRIAFRTKDTDAVAEVAQQRIDAIAEIRKQLWLALCTLFNNGESDASDSVKKQASRFSEPFEKTEDARFFDDLVLQIESATPEAEYERWLLDLAERARAVLRAAFDAGPRSGMRRYRAQSGALNKFDRALRSDKSPLKTLARLYRERSESKIPQETLHDAN